MQELAGKDFANLREDSDDSEPQHKIARRGRPPGKNSRKSSGMSPSERVAPDSSSDVTLASGGDNATGPNSYNLRKGIGKFQPADSFVRTSHSTLNSTGYTNWLTEWENEFPGQGPFLCFFSLAFSLNTENMICLWLIYCKSCFFFIYFSCSFCFKSCFKIWKEAIHG